MEGHPRRMSRVILDFSADLDERVRSRAELEGIPVADYVMREMEKATSIPSEQDLWERLKQLPPVPLGESGAELVRAAREERMQYLDELFDDLRNRR